jgi:hypothetical protein
MRCRGRLHCWMCPLCCCSCAIRSVRLRVAVYFRGGLVGGKWIWGLGFLHLWGADDPKMGERKVRGPSKSGYPGRSEFAAVAVESNSNWSNQHLASNPLTKRNHVVESLPLAPSPRSTILLLPQKSGESGRLVSSTRRKYNWCMRLELTSQCNYGCSVPRGWMVGAVDTEASMCLWLYIFMHRCVECIITVLWLRLGCCYYIWKWHRRSYLCDKMCV